MPLVFWCLPRSNGPWQTPFVGPVGNVVDQWLNSRWTFFPRYLEVQQLNRTLTNLIRCYFSPSLISHDLLPCKLAAAQPLSLGKPTLSWLKAVRLGKLQQLP